MDASLDQPSKKGRVFFLVIVMILFLGYFSVRLAAPDDLSKSAVGVSADGNRADVRVSEEEVEIAPVSSSDHVRGSARAEVHIIEFSDFDCPYCAQFHETMRAVVEHYEGRVAWAYRHFPILQIHPNAQVKAVASECVAAFGGNEVFWDFADYLFLHQDTTPSQLPFVAENFSLDGSTFASCLGSGKYMMKVNNDRVQAMTAGGTGTPYSVLMYQDQKISLQGASSFETMRKIIDSLIGE